LTFTVLERKVRVKLRDWHPEGTAVLSREGFSKGLIYDVFGFTIIQCGDTALLCYVLLDDKNTLALKSTRMFEEVPLFPDLSSPSTKTRSE
jgi:hypothetical protein